MKLRPSLLVAFALSCLSRQVGTSLVVREHPKNEDEHRGSQQHHVSDHKHPSKPQHLRASARTKPSSSADAATIVNLRHELAEEKSLRLKENGLAKKLTAVLSRTTKALKVKSKCSNEAEKKQIAKLKQASDSDRNARQNAEAKADSLTKELKAIDEKNEKMTVEVAELTTQLASTRLEHRDSGTELKNLKAEIEALKAENKKLTSTSDVGKKELDALRDHLDEAEAARTSKSEELAKTVLEIEDLKKKEKRDLAELERKNNETMQSMRLHFEKQSAFQKNEAESSIAVASKKIESLTDAKEKLQLKIKQEASQIEQAKKQQQSAEEKIRSQQKALDTAHMEIAKQKVDLAKDASDMNTLKTKADQLNKTQQQVEALALANSGLNQTNEERNSALEKALAKVQAESDELRVTHAKLQDTSWMLTHSGEAERKATTRVQQMQESLRQAQANFQMNEEDLKTVKEQLEASTEEKDVLTKELDETQAKLAELERREKEISAVHEQLSQIQSLLKTKEQNLHSMQEKLQKFVDKDQEWAATKDKLKELVAEQKDLLNQMAATRQHEKDEVSVAQAKENEMNDRRNAAEQRELELKASTRKELDKMLEELKEVKEKAAIASKPALVAGRSILRSRNLERVLVKKEHELKLDQAKLKHLQAELSAKDVELANVRKALLSAARTRLPSASAQEAAAAKAVLEKIDGKLYAKVHELNATQAELEASKNENSIERKEIEVLKDDRIVLGTKVKKLSAALIKEIKEEKQLHDDVAVLKNRVSSAEHSRQEMEHTNAELIKVAKEARKHAEEEVAAKSNAEKEAEKVAAERAAEQHQEEQEQEQEQARAQQQKEEQKKERQEQVQAQQQEEQEQEQEQEQKQEQEQQEQEQTPRRPESQPQAKVSDGQDDDGETDDDSDASDPSLVASVPWGSIEKVMAKNLQIVDKAAKARH
mmetsp:Transcript_35708/g.56908  ORF Transcript_35708/g.56908 Transcript_35708/m.56908 type:complete len:942 (+) Transcript_35708:89-2914(+)